MVSCLLLIYDPIAVWSLIVALVSAIAAIIGAIAAVDAAKYAREAPTKKDLARVEDNTAHLEEVRAGIVNMNARLKKQEEAEEIHLRANRISIDASGNCSTNVSYPLQLSIKEPIEENFEITHIELFNEHGNTFGSVDCLKTDNLSALEYRAAIPIETLSNWFQNGTLANPMNNKMRVKLRVWMSIDGVAHFRDMAVIVTRSISGEPTTYIVEGRV